MTPKEKALQLYARYYDRIEHTLSEEYSQYEKNVVKQCALIAIDEMIGDIIGNGLNIYFNNRHNYWQKVKQEIEKL